MTVDDALRDFDIAPDTGASTLRLLLATEIKQIEHEQGDEALIKLLCFQLFRLGNVEDALLIWQAKFASFDLTVRIDVQLLCGAGLEQTKAYLAVHKDEQAAHALEYICECEAGGDFAGFSPQGFQAAYAGFW